MSNRRIRPIAMYLLLFLVIAFIWGNSILPTEESGEISSGVAKWLAGLFGLEALPFDVRKAAHFCEYTALGMLLAFLAGRRSPLMPIHIFCWISTGMFIAVADESIQILSQRGPMVTDVLLDFAGCISGFCLCLLIQRIFRPKRTQ